MKIIVVAGAHRRVGKTTTLRNIKSVLNNSVSIKLGKIGEVDKNKEELLLPYETTLGEIMQKLDPVPDYLLIEGNHILSTLQPDLAVFVEGSGPNRKADADFAKSKCNLVVGTEIKHSEVALYADKLCIYPKQFTELINKLNININ